MTNPHHPFTYRDQEIRHIGDRGDRYDADVLQLRDGWSWSARYSAWPVDSATLGGDESTIMDEIDAPADEVSPPKPRPLTQPWPGCARGASRRTGVVGDCATGP